LTTTAAFKETDHQLSLKFALVNLTGELSLAPVLSCTVIYTTNSLGSSKTSKFAPKVLSKLKPLHMSRRKYYILFVALIFGQLGEELQYVHLAGSLAMGWRVA